MSNEDIDLSYKYCKDNQVLLEKEENLLSIKHHLKNKQRCIKIIKQHLQNVNKKQQLQNQNDVELKIG